MNRMKLSAARPCDLGPKYGETRPCDVVALEELAREVNVGVGKALRLLDATETVAECDDCGAELAARRVVVFGRVRCGGCRSWD